MYRTYFLISSAHKPLNTAVLMNVHFNSCQNQENIRWNFFQVYFFSKNQRRLSRTWCNCLCLYHGMIFKELIFIVDIIIILTILLETKRKYMNLDIASSKRGCQICIQQESIRASHIDVIFVFGMTIVVSVVLRGYRGKTVEFLAH